LNRSAQNLTLFPEEAFPVEGPLVFEAAARKSGYTVVAGVDEAGRGPLAGPVVAAAVVLPEDAALDGVQDSKQMTEKARTEAFSVICATALALGVGVIPPSYIDAHNILNASLEAMRRAVSFLESPPDFLLVDGICPVPTRTHQRCLKQGDRRSLSISAASVIAKVYRDRIMCSFDTRFPQYGFSSHKGYGTSAHFEALRRHGPCPIHRRTFHGVLEPKDAQPS
jgi:ribonuclease HII